MRLALLAGAMLAVGCLPGDTRPVPATLDVTIEASAATRAQFATSDGWQITFERVLLALGNERIDGDSCNEYASAEYGRIWDMVALDGPKKQGLAYGLNACDLSVRLRVPSDDAIVEDGVTEADKTAMRTPGKDAWEAVGGESVVLRGRATKGDRTERFAWIIRRSWEIKDCPTAGDAGLSTHFDLTGGQTIAVPIVIHAETVFRAAADDDAPLVFEPFAAADADGDGVITLDELKEVSAPAWDADAGTGGADGGASTLGDLLYTVQIPRMIRPFDGRACTAEARTRRFF